MNFSIILIIVVCLIGLIGTLLVAGKSDKGYYSAAKKNVTHLTLIYIIAILGSLIALGVFIVNLQ